MSRRSILTKYEKETVNDYQNLLGVRLDTTDNVAKLLLMQTLCGHSEHGHGVYSQKWPNSTFWSLSAALYKGGATKFRPRQIMEKRQNEINKIYQFLDDIITGKKVSRFKVKRQVLAGAGPLGNIEIRGDKGREAILIGMYLGACMDNFEWREKVQETYGVQMGGGHCVPVNLQKLSEEGLTLKMLARKEHNEEDIKELKRKGVLPEIPLEGLETTPKLTLGYVRRKFGKGISDDLGILCAGLVYKPLLKLAAGLETAGGLFLLDHIDTMDKFTPLMFYGGQDERFADLIEHRMPEIKQHYPNFALPTEDEVIKFLYTIALDYEKDQKLVVRVSDSSQRYLLQINGNEHPLSPLRSYLKFLRGEKTHRVRVGYKNSKVWNRIVQNEAKRRVDIVYGKDGARI